MSILKLEKIVSFSSESKKFPTSNLLHRSSSTDTNKKWLAQSPTEDTAFVLIKLEKPSIVTAADIGNDGSAFIEVFVSNDKKEFFPLIPKSSFMSPMESRMDETRNRIRCFTSFDAQSANKAWTYIKIVCSQPYNKNWPFGIEFIAFRGTTEAQDEVKREDTIEPTESLRSETEEVAKEKDEPSTVNETVSSQGHTAHSVEGTNQRSSNSRSERHGEQQTNRRQILRGVVFALSGFQNPQRRNLRDLAISMGARYLPDWNPQCTHLICAFSNTPKWSRVAVVGGRIVTQKWLEECDRLKRKLPWREFKCGRYRDKSQDTTDMDIGSDLEESEHEDVEDDGSDYEPNEEDSFDSPTRKKKKRDDTSSAPPLPEDCHIDELGNFFDNKVFFLGEDCTGSDERNTLIRYIVGHGGKLVSACDSADFVISWKEGAYSPKWVVMCHQKNQFIEK